MKLSVPDNIAKLIPYNPGKPIDALEREVGALANLASNENPLGPSPKAIEAVRQAAAQLHRYPDGGCTYLIAALAERYGLPANHFIVGNGSNEVIDDIVNTYLRPGDVGLTGENAFIVFLLAIQARGGTLERAPFRNYRHDVDATIAAIDERTRFVYLDNPNNPCGTFVSQKDVDRLVEALPEDCWLLLDEAYYEYVEDPDYPDGIQYVRDARRVVVLRTFSKIFGLAGLRVGYGVADPEFLGYVNRLRDPFNVNHLAQVGALAAGADATHLESCRKLNNEGKAWLAKEFSTLGIEFAPTVANFYLVHVGDGERVSQALLQQGVFVRTLRGFGLPEHVRITIGTHEENVRAIETLRTVLP